MALVKSFEDQLVKAVKVARNLKPAKFFWADISCNSVGDKGPGARCERNYGYFVLVEKDAMDISYCYKCCFRNIWFKRIPKMF